MASSKVLQTVVSKATNIVSGSSSFNLASTGTGRQGSALMNVIITPKSSSSRIILDVNFPIAGETARHSNGMAFAIYRDNSIVAEQIYADMMADNIEYPSLIGSVTTCTPVHFGASVVGGPAGIPIIFHVYGGCDGGAVQINGCGNTSPTLALGANASTFTATEILTVS
jgi:hypothetical protein